MMRHLKVLRQHFLGTVVAGSWGGAPWVLRAKQFVLLVWALCLTLSQLIWAQHIHYNAGFDYAENLCGCWKLCKMHFVLIFIIFAFQGVHGCHFWLHFWLHFCLFTTKMIENEPKMSQKWLQWTTLMLLNLYLAFQRTLTGHGLSTSQHIWMLMSKYQMAGRRFNGGEYVLRPLLLLAFIMTYYDSFIG
jgi:hypothetical protein